MQVMVWRRHKSTLIRAVGLKVTDRAKRMHRSHRCFASNLNLLMGIDLANYSFRGD
jgi:hypothetical protein